MLLPRPQSVRGGRVRPIETAPIAALPIMVKRTRRERFIGAIPSASAARVSISHHRPASQSASSHENLSAIHQPPPPKKAWANEPKPPRLTELELELDDEDDDELLDDDESLLKKLLREEPQLLELWPPELDDELRGVQSAPGCGVTGAAMPGAGGGTGWQFGFGISA